MATCKYCGQSSFFLTVNSRGLCANCAPFVENDIAMKGKNVLGKLQEIFNPIDPDMLKPTLQIIFDDANYLMQKYQVREIETINPPPSEIVKNLLKVFEVASPIMGSSTVKHPNGTVRENPDNGYREGIVWIYKGKKYLEEDGISEVRFLRMNGEFEKAEQIILECGASPAIADEYRKVKSKQAALAKKNGDWTAVVLYLETYNHYADQIRDECIKLVKQEPPSHTATDKILLDLAYQKIRDAS